MTSETRAPAPHDVRVLVVLVAGSVLGLSGIDLVLPAIPSLASALHGSAEQAQWVLASYVAGTGLGLLAFGALRDAFGPRALLVASFVVFGLVSLACARASAMLPLVALRFVQGAASSAAAVFAPGIIRASFDDARAVRALGALGSVESLVPALAPIAGAWLLTVSDHRASFVVTGVASLVLACAAVALREGRPSESAARPRGSYARLVRDPVFMRYACSQAMTLGGLLTFVFGLPAVILGPLHGTLTGFVTIQVIGVSAFVLTSSNASRVVERWGAEVVIARGSALGLASAVALAIYAAVGGASAYAIAALSVPMNVGLGLRGPPGFFRAVVAAGDDDARGAALVVLAVMLTAAFGTTGVAPFITEGLLPLALASAALHLGSVVTLRALPPLA